MADHLLAAEISSRTGCGGLKRKTSISPTATGAAARSVLTRARCRIRRGLGCGVLEQQRAAKADGDRRRQTQPLTQRQLRSVSSIRPAISRAADSRAWGWKGRAEGGAQISDRHANFIVNLETRAPRTWSRLSATQRRPLSPARRFPG